MNQITSAIRNWIDRVLHGTHNHFSCYLPHDVGIISSLTFKLLFSEIRLEEEQMEVLRQIPKDAVVVYATKYKSYLEYFFYHTRYQKSGIKHPDIGFDYKVRLIQPVSRVFRIMVACVDHFFRHMSLPDPYKSGYIKQELINGKAGFLSLVEHRGFYLRFVKERTDPLKYLIEMQSAIDQPIVIVPQLMFFSKNPQRSVPTLIDIIFGSEERPGRIRRLTTVMRNPGKVFVEISEPVNLKTFMEYPENKKLNTERLSLILRRRLLIQINRHRQSITGPVLKSREELKENILTNDRLRSYMSQYAETRELSISKVRKESEGYLDEIAAKYNLSMIWIFSFIVKWLTNLMFEGVTVNRDVLNRVKNMSKRGPLVLVPCHKSHIDYMILSYILYHNNMPCPHIAAGKNLSFWPLGPLFRSGGAFFIRRTFKGAVLYSKIFAEYVFKLLEEGFNIEFFIEGGRSRSGKLLKPKLGLLSILLNAYKEGACEDMIFVPVYIGYDRVLEESSYLHELEGGQKKQESFLDVVRARKFLKKRYGKIYIQFHESISVGELLVHQGKDIREMTSKEYNGFCRNLGYRLLNAIDRVTVITPHAVVAAAALNCSKKRFSYDYLKSDIEIYMNYLIARKIKLADTLLIDYVYAVRYVFDLYVQRKFIERIPAEKNSPVSEEVFEVIESRRPLLEYYKNNGITAFISASFTALAILEKDAFQFSVSDISPGYKFLRDFFINEFAYDVDKTPDDVVRNNIEIFIREAVLMPHPTLPDTYNLTAAGFRKLKVFAAFIKTFFESYWVVLNFFMRYPKNFTDTKDRMKKIQSLGQRMLKREEIERREAISRINFSNAVDFFTSNGVKGSEDTQSIEFYAEAIHRYMRHLS